MEWKGGKVVGWVESEWSGRVVKWRSGWNLDRVEG